MVSPCKGLPTFYRRTVRVAAAVVVSWLFVSCLVFRNFIDIVSAFLSGLFFMPQARVLPALQFFAAAGASDFHSLCHSAGRPMGIPDLVRPHQRCYDDAACRRDYPSGLLHALRARRIYVFLPPSIRFGAAALAPAVYLPG